MLARFLQNGAVFTAFDTETTGLRSSTCRIIEIGAVQFSLDGVHGRFDTLICPETAIPADCTAVNHITDDMVRGKPPIRDVLPRFTEFLGSSIIVAHNAQFDMNFINAELERNARPPLSNLVIDTLQLCRWAYPDAKKYSQQAMAERMGIPVKNAHRAYDDAFVCGNIFLHCIRDTAALQKL